MKQQSWKSTGTCAAEFLLFQMRPRQYSPCMQCLKENRVVKVSKSSTTSVSHHRDNRLLAFTRTKAWAQVFAHPDLDNWLRVYSPLGSIYWARMEPAALHTPNPHLLALLRPGSAGKHGPHSSQSEQRHILFIMKPGIHCPGLTCQDQGSPILKCFQNRTQCISGKSFIKHAAEFSLEVMMIHMSCTCMSWQRVSG